MNKRLVDALQYIETLRPRPIAFGALARKLLLIINQLAPDVVELTCKPAAWHNLPEKIGHGMKAKVKVARKAGFIHFVIFGDCGTGGQLYSFFDEENVAHIPRPHRHHSFMGEADFDAVMDQDLATFLLTDYYSPSF
ncbi:MAG TPA: hypothetical protein DE276_07790 [Oceanospirillaceae bacterium]|nr:hypothetical protein [Oceanospirillaceae bacterium]